MNFIKRFSFLIAITALGQMQSYAEIPAGYYDSCEGKTGQALLSALCSTISSHTTVSYAGLWDLYKTSDIDENGKIWDMYSTKRWNPGSEQCGSYSSVGDCYNREHSMPKSWFNDASPMYSDAFHLYPTDGKVNGQRSNYPFGECASGTTLSSSGSVKALGRLGTSTFAGYTGKVFEPDDQYKGDFARSYFYMAACYNDRISSWSSDMLAKNSYPVFTSWAQNLLLKWTRQDEVSQKELNRQEAVYAKQKNRNPFIDHPELAEYIWGDKVGTPWYSTASVEPDIVMPVKNVTIDLGLAAINVATSKTVTVKTKGVEGTVYLSIYDPTGALSISPRTLTADQANQGYDVTITCNATKGGTIAGTMSISADDMEREVDVVCNVLDGLPIYDAQNVSDDQFTVCWVNIGLQSTYDLDVRLGSQSLAGYPKAVSAAAQSYTVTGLEPLTTYTFQLSAGSLTSDLKSVTTADLIPEIDILFDGSLEFETAPGLPSDIAELLLYTENVADDISISVDAPFEVSVDKTNWSTSISLTPEQDRFYMRVNSATTGDFSTSIRAKAGDFLADDFTATAKVLTIEETSFIETFDIEDAADYAPYKTNTTFVGTACSWKLTNAGIGNQTQDAAVNGTKVIRFGNDTTSALEMTDDKKSGLGRVTFEVSKWGTDATPTVALEYSTDGGANWIEAQRFTFDTSGSNLTTCSADINVTGSGRIRFRQTAGKRWFLDNVSITNFTEIQGIAELPYHSWDAYCTGGQLVVETKDDAANVAIYSVDGIVWHSGQLDRGTHRFDLPHNLYIVVSAGYSRRVVVM